MLEAKLEALLFVVGEEGISLNELAFLVKASTQEVYETIASLQARYQADDASALTILEVGDHFLLATKKDYSELLKSYAQSPLSNRLSKAALETLSIIAYKQPITRMEIEDIRGVQASGAVQKLVARQLITEIGRVDGPGRAILYGTTHYFMDYFGLKTMADLPSIEEMEIEFSEEEEQDLFFERFEELSLEQAASTSTDEEEEGK